jgi:hypothetical protein
MNSGAVNKKQTLQINNDILWIKIDFGFILDV